MEDFINALKEENAALQKQPALCSYEKCQKPPPTAAPLIGLRLHSVGRHSMPRLFFVHRICRIKRRNRSEQKILKSANRIPKTGKI